jgi:hypothetical protein
MHSLTHVHTPRIHRRPSAGALVHLASTEAQAARLLGLGHYPGDRPRSSAKLWDAGLIDRLSTPITRVRE